MLFDFTAQRVVRRASLGIGLIRSLAAIGDGRRILVAGAGQEVVLWDFQANAAQRRYPVDVGVRELVLQVAKRRLATLGTDNSLRLLDLSTGKTTTIATAGVLHAAISPDGNRLATLHAGGDCRAWSLERLRLLAEVKASDRSPVKAIGWMGERVVLVDGAGRCGYWQLPLWPQSLPNLLPANKAAIIATAPNGAVLAAAGNQLAILEATSDATHRLVQLPGNVAALHAGDAGGLVAVSDGRLFSLHYAAAAIAPLGSLDPPLDQIVFSPDSRRLAGVDEAGNLRFAEIDKKYSVSPVIGSGWKPICLRGESRAIIWDGSRNSLAEVDRERPGELLWELPFGNVEAVRFGSNGLLSILEGGPSGKGVSVVDLEHSEGRLLRRSGLAASISGDASKWLLDDLLAVAGEGGGVALFDFYSNRCLSLGGSDSWRPSVVVGDAGTVAVVDDSGGLRVWRWSKHRQ